MPEVPPPSGEADVEQHSSRRAKPEARRSARSPRERFANPIPEIVFPEALPVSARRDEIARALRDHQVIIVSGETGSGKTTQLPKIALSIGRGLGAGGSGLIGHTQPRRLAATSVARRIAQELGSPLGEHVGFKIRFNDQLSRGASIKLMTDGILLAETQSDPMLRAYDTLIIDEAHERSLNIDFLLGYLRQLLPKRPDLKVIVTSATIDAGRFAQHFAHGDRPAPVVEVSGRMYPVEVRWRPRLDDQDASDSIVAAVDEATAIGPGDVLVFLPGEREIRETAEALRKHHPAHTEILPLFSRLSAEEQDRIFKPSNARRIVLATNVAETSLTVPGIRYVVDPGTARVKRYSYRQKVEQLQIEAISQASANQRAGRCGRVAAGVCVRLYSEQDFSGRAQFSEPEILRSSLAAVILRMKSLGLEEIDRFPFVEPPPGRAVADGYALLQELGALDERNDMTDVGHQLARLPLDPRVGRMLLAAKSFDCLTEATIIAAALSVQDARERPFGQEDAADQAHKKFADDKSEFVGMLKRWSFYDEALTHKKSNSKLRDVLKSWYLHPLRMREWRDVHAQLHSTLSELGWHFNERPAPYDALHLALLTGLLGNISFKSEDDPHYDGARGLRLFIWPGSTLGKKAGRWIVAAELVETSRLFARTVARIEPEWIERVAAHLLKRSQGDPHWEKRAGRVNALERGTLYGLTVYQNRRIDYGAINPTHAREIFLREALVPGEIELKLSHQHDFIAHNRKLVREIEQLEHKARRLDVLVDESLIYAFYDAQIPAEVVDVASLERWYRDETKRMPKLLFLSRDDLMRHEAAGVTTDLFPKTIEFGGVEMALNYHFEPGSPRDGVTLAVPIYALNLVDEARCEWLVAGMLKEKVHLLLKSLPQKLRRAFVPLPESAREFTEALSAPFEGGLLDALRGFMRAAKQVDAQPADFKLETLPAHLFMNFKVVDRDGRQLAMERSLSALRAQFGREARAQFQALAAQATQTAQAVDDRREAVVPARTSAVPAAVHHSAALVDWSFGELPELLEIRKGAQTLVGYPALVDAGDHALLEVFDDPAEARKQHRLGLRRLLALQLRDQLKFLDRNIPNLAQMAMHYMPLGSQEELKQQIIDVALDRACLSDPLPLNAEQFHARRDEGKGRLNLLAQDIARLAATILAEYAAVLRKLSQAKSHAEAFSDLQTQLAELMPRNFLVDQPFAQLAHVPRYLKAITLRIDKLRVDPMRDQRSMADLRLLLVNLHRKRASLKGVADDRLDEFRWLLEELRVSLFAQELRTPMPVSVKRLTKVWESIR